MEELQITVDFQVSQAVANAQQLAAALRMLQEQTEGYATAAQAADAATKQLATSAPNATAGVNKLGGATQQAANVTATYTQNVLNATQNVNNFSTSSVTNINNVTNATNNLSSSTGGLNSQVLNLAKGYFGMTAIIKIFDDLLARLRAVKEAQQDLMGVRSGFESNFRELASNLKMNGPEGESHLLKIVQQVQSLSKASIGTIKAAVEATSQQGFDINGLPGQQFAAELASTAERRGFSEDTIKLFARQMNQSGVRDVNALRLAEAQQEAAFAASQDANPDDFARGALAMLGPEGAKHADRTKAEAIYASMIGMSRTDRQASEEGRAVYDFAQSTNPKALAFLAKQAAQLGVINTGDQAAAFNAAVAGGTSPEARAIRNEREKLELDRMRAQAEDDKYEAAHRHPRRRSTPEQRATEQTAHEASVMERDAGYATRQRDIDEKSERLRDKLTTQAQIDALQKIGLQDRVDKILLPAAMRAQGDTESMNRFETESGGLINRSNALFLLASPQGQRKMQEVQRAMGLATGADAVKANELFQAREGSKDTDLQASLTLKELIATGPASGIPYMNRLDKQATEEWKILAATGKLKADIDSPGAVIDALFGQTKSRQALLIGARDLEKDMAAMQATLAPGSSEARELKTLQDALSKEILTDNPDNLVVESAASTLRTIGTGFGSFQATVGGRNRAKAGGGATPAPKAAPVAGSARSDATIIHNHYNQQTYRTTHIGTQFMDGGYGEDTPGRLEGMLG